MCASIVTRIMADGSLGPSAAVSDDPGEYVVTFDCGYYDVRSDWTAGIAADASTSEAGAPEAGGPEAFTHVYVGVVARIEAVVDTQIRGIDLSSLDTIGDAVTAGRALGKLNFYLVGVRPADGGPPLQSSPSIDAGAIRSAKTFLGSIWTLASDPAASLKPQAFRACVRPRAQSPFESANPDLAPPDGATQNRADATVPGVDASSSSEAGSPRDSGPGDASGDASHASEGMKKDAGPSPKKDGGSSGK
jgi:hypothetical protein